MSAASEVSSNLPEGAVNSVALVGINFFFSFSCFARALLTGGGANQLILYSCTALRTGKEVVQPTIEDVASFKIWACQTN